MEPIKFISPSKFAYWEKCPIKAIYGKTYTDLTFFPKHPDADLGTILHYFLEKKKELQIKSINDFEEIWLEKIIRLEKEYLNNKLQKVYYPIKWHAKYFSVKKILLRNEILKHKNPPKSAKKAKGEITEKWIDDGEDIGGIPDKFILNDSGKIIKIIDYKTGNIFEFINKKKVLKETYVKQLLLYAYIIKSKQNEYPICYIQDLHGNNHEVKIDENLLNETYARAVELKNKINKAIQTRNYEPLANPDFNNCHNCEYRPVCSAYKNNFINNFENKKVDVFGEIIDIKGSEKIEIKLKITEKELVLKGILSQENVSIGDNVYIYNLFCPDGASSILYAIKETLIRNE
ncbi:MAG: PD-(D/E)XK nuclease family protein [Bacteroidetes bacterium]|nr:PD-(D/E)XK nuclease family protein [Bacteroidota bacterium]